MFLKPKKFSARLTAVATLSSVVALFANAEIAPGTPNVPADNKILFIMGQDTTTLRDYNNEVLNVDASMPKPGGVTLYTAIIPTFLDGNNSAPAGSTHYLSGIEGAPADLTNGEVNFFETFGTYDGQNNAKVAVNVGLFISDSFADCGNQPLRAIIGGSEAVRISGNPGAGDDVGEISDPSSMAWQFNDALRRMVRFFRDDNRPVYLRIGFEFDGPWNCYDQNFYKAAFIRVKDIINEEGATNVATVWQAATYPDNGDARFNFDPFPSPDNPNQTPRNHYDSWYPTREDGTDDVVDWVGISLLCWRKLFRKSMVLPGP